MTATPSNLSRVVPLLAVLAAAAAVAAWILPLPFLGPPKPKASQGLIASLTAQQNRQAAAADTPLPGSTLAFETSAPPDWRSLAEPLNIARSPMQTEQEVAEAVDPVTEAPLEPPPPRPSLNWEYVGFVDEGDRLVAVVTIGGLQRFLYEGDTVPGLVREDEPVRVERVTPEELVVTVQGEETTIERNEPAIFDPLGGARAEVAPDVQDEAMRGAAPRGRMPRGNRR